VFQNTLVRGDYFEISKSLAFKTMKNSSTAPETCLATKDMVDIMQLFASLSTHITSQNQHLQEQIRLNDIKMSQDFQQVVQAHIEFKQELNEELDELSLLLSRQQSPGNTMFSSSTPVVTNPSTSLILAPRMSASNFGKMETSTMDVHTQMMQILTDSISKLPSAFIDKGFDSKMDWPKFDGDQKKC